MAISLGRRATLQLRSSQLVKPMGSRAADTSNIQIKHKQMKKKDFKDWSRTAQQHRDFIKEGFEEMLQLDSESRFMFTRTEAMDLDNRMKRYPNLYSTEQPGEHTEADLGKYYNLDLDTLPYAVNQGPLAEDLGWTDGYMMVRQNALESVEKLKEITNFDPQEGQEVERPAWLGQTVGIKGGQGTGKTAALSYCIQYAQKAGWLVLSTFGREFPHETLGFITQSKHQKAHYDQPLYTAQFFRTLMKDQGDILKKISLKRSYDYWEELEKPVGTSLYDLVKLSTDEEMPELAPPILKDFVQELLLVHEVPMLIAVDGINEWDEKSSFVDPKHPFFRNLNARRLGLVDTFTHLQRKPPQNAVFMFTLTSVCIQRLAHKHLKFCKNVLTMKQYSPQENVNALNHYSVAKVLGVHTSEIDPKFFAYARGLTGGNPRLTYDYCTQR